MKILKCFSTKCRRTYIGDTEGLNIGDPNFFRWYKIQLKLFGYKWITIHRYIVNIKYNLNE